MEFRCSICDGLVPRKQYRQHRTCEKIECRFAHRAKMRVAEQEATRKWEERNRKRWETAVSASKEISTSEVSSDQIFLVPTNDYLFRELPEKRRREFRNHLLRMISQATALPAGPVVTQPAQETPSPLLGSACETCRGHCCTGGGTEAYLTGETIREYMDANPDLRPRDVLASYLARLPNRSYVDSCVFHSKTGCTLTRAMRSTTCNEFECSYLKLVGERKKPVGQPLYLVALNDTDEVVQVQEFRHSALGGAEPAGAKPS